MTGDATTSELLAPLPGARCMGVFGTAAAGALATARAATSGTSTASRYLDLLGGIAVNALGHGHPALVSAISKQAGEAVHVSNFFTSRRQIALAERLLEIAEAPTGPASSSPTPAPRRSRPPIKLTPPHRPHAASSPPEGAFHGRTTGALALTHKAAYREPFEPLIPGVSHVPYGDEDALRAAVDADDRGRRPRADPGRGRRARAAGTATCGWPAS